jgi:hypothetical protein
MSNNTKKEICSDALRPDAPDAVGEGAEPLVFAVTLVVRLDRTTQIRFHQEYPPDHHLHDLAHVLEDTWMWLEQVRLSQTLQESLVKAGKVRPVILPPGGLDFPLGRA